MLSCLQDSAVPTFQANHLKEGAFIFSRPIRHLYLCTVEANTESALLPSATDLFCKSTMEVCLKTGGEGDLKTDSNIIITQAGAEPGHQGKRVIC